MSNATVWLNGKELGGRPYGYIGFGFDLTPTLHFGGEKNVLAVRLTPEEQLLALVSRERAFIAMYGSTSPARCTLPAGEPMSPPTDSHG